MLSRGDWRIWDWELGTWLEGDFPGYPEERLRGLNGQPGFPPWSGDSPIGGGSGGLARIGYFAACGAALGGPLAVWLLLPGPPGPGEGGCGLEVLGAFVFGLPGGALLGGLIGLLVALAVSLWKR
jgi:hypothetical protein